MFMNPTIQRAAIAAAALAALAYAALTAGRAADAADAAMKARLESLSIRAVLREGALPGAADKLAADLARATPGLTARAVTAAEARGRLALQEPWIRHLPEVDLGDALPETVEIRHPAMADDPAAVRDHIAALEARPEVEFVQFNGIAHESQRAFRATSSAAARRAAATVRWCCLAAAAGVVALAATSTARRRP